MLSQTEAVSAKRLEFCAPMLARRVAAMLDLPPDHPNPSQPLPRGWHFFLLAGDTRRSQLRSDGFPGFGVPMPDLGLPRLLLIGRSVVWAGDLEIDEQVERVSEIEEVREKTGPSGRFKLVKLRHTLRPSSQAEPAVTETQTYALLPAAPPPARVQEQTEMPKATRQCTITADETLLFQYSALGFNSHKIHLDKAYAQKVEGLPDLVVNGGLTTLLATEFLRNELGVVPSALRARHSAPLYCNRPMTILADPSATGWRLRVLDDHGTVAAELEVDIA